MKAKTLIFLSCLICLIILFLAQGYSSAAQETKPQILKIGVVDIQKVFNSSKKNKAYEEQAETEKQKILAELEKLSREIDAEKAGLNTLKSGTPDYMTQMKTIMQKQADLQVQQKFQEQQISLKYQQRIEEFYQDLLQITAQIAREKELTMVLTKDRVEFPAANMDNLMRAIQSNKVLYSEPNLDISDQVIAQLDAENR